MTPTENQKPQTANHTPRRFFAAPEQFSGNEILLSPAETHHLTRVLRLSQGAQVEIFDGQGKEYEARIIAFEAQGARLQIMTERPGLDESPLTITLGLALARSDTFDLAIRQATEMGVNNFIPFFSERSIVKPKSWSRSRLDRWERLARETLKSCQRQVMPQIELPVDFPEAIQASEDVKIIFWEETRRHTPNTALSTIPAPRSARLLIGPEGGFTPAEVDLARSAGFMVLGLGPRRLKVETAALAALTIVQYSWGDLTPWQT
jgi:16S rRNA (uracil1498-N3)-methyltransferase